MKALRVYVDTSVLGGCFDAEFAVESNALMRKAREGGAILVVSDLLVEELANAPAKVRALPSTLPPHCIVRVSRSEESRSLHSAYLKARVVGRAQTNDAHHVALATIARVDVIVSWNFKHIVHWDKIRRFNAVNLVQGYSEIGRAHV